MDQYAVFGHPISHSLSPRIHTHFAEQTQQALQYQAVCIELDAFEQQVQRFFTEGGKGLNITVPFKQRAYAMCQQLTARAELAGAVNTLYVKDGLLWGDNTDGVGLIRDITVNQQLPLQGQRCLILGAGGAVRGILLPLIEQQPATICIANRTKEKAQALADMFQTHAHIDVAAFAELQGMTFDWIINGTSAGLSGDLPPLPEDVLRAGGYCYDMVYSSAATAFQCWAKAHQASVSVDGLGMLIEQAAEAFDIWRGVRPETQVLFSLLR